MSFILEFTKSQGVTSIEDAFNLWIRNGWVDTTIDRRKEVYDHYLIELKSHVKKKAIKRTAVKFKYTDRSIHSFIKLFETMTSENIKIN